MAQRSQGPGLSLQWSCDERHVNVQYNHIKSVVPEVLICICRLVMWSWVRIIQIHLLGRLGQTCGQNWLRLLIKALKSMVSLHVLLISVFCHCFNFNKISKMLLKVYMKLYRINIKNVWNLNYFQSNSISKSLLALWKKIKFE